MSSAPDISPRNDGAPIFANDRLLAGEGIMRALMRAKIERAGLAFDVDCPPLPEPIHVDSDMWEKIVLNLLSNALKFTFDGTISAALE